MKTKLNCMGDKLRIIIISLVILSWTHILGSTVSSHEDSPKRFLAELLNTHIMYKDCIYILVKLSKEEPHAVGFCGVMNSLHSRIESDHLSSCHVVLQSRDNRMKEWKRDFLVPFPLICKMYTILVCQTRDSVFVVVFWEWTPEECAKAQCGGTVRHLPPLWQRRGSYDGDVDVSCTRWDLRNTQLRAMVGSRSRWSSTEIFRTVTPVTDSLVLTSELHASSSSTILWPDQVLPCMGFSFICLTSSVLAVDPLSHRVSVLAPGRWHLDPVSHRVSVLVPGR